MDKRVTFYIDGFNFYYGLKNSGADWKRFYWIDIVKLFESFLKENEKLESVRYYTARPINVDKRERQNTLMKVNKKLNGDKFKIFYGKYKKKIITCQASCKEEFELPEEKQTDVHIAVDILEDYIINKCDKSILISADSDLLPPIRSIIRLEETIKRGHQVEILFPPGQFSSDMQNCGISVKKMEGYKSRFNKSLLPYEVKCHDKIKIQIPPKWKTFLEEHCTSHMN